MRKLQSAKIGCQSIAKKNNFHQIATYQFLPHSFLAFNRQLKNSMKQFLKIYENILRVRFFDCYECWLFIRALYWSSCLGKISVYLWLLQIWSLQSEMLQGMFYLYNFYSFFERERIACFDLLKLFIQMKFFLENISKNLLIFQKINSLE